MTQYVVAVFLDGTLNVSAAGPFRSRAKADAAAERINEAGAWSAEDYRGAAIVAQVVALQPTADLVEEGREK